MSAPAHFPEGWWRARPLVLAHRGASRAAPENTLSAFRAAAALGADGVELDVHLSADGVPVVMHNATVDATTDGRGWINDLSLAQLKALDAGAHFGPQFAGERIPTLEEVLAEVGRRLLVNIELKDQGTRAAGLEAAVIDVVQRLGMQDRVWFSSFKPYSLALARRLAPRIPCGLLYAPFPFNLGYGLLAPLTPYEALHPQASLLSEMYLRNKRARGLRVITWTVDDVAAAQIYAAWGVDAIITNDPERLLRAL